MQLAVFPWSTVVTVTVALPIPAPVNKPVAETAAKDEALLDHVTFGLVASGGVIVGVSWSVLLAGSFSCATRLTPVT
jgi:hypothetical protein